MLQKRFKQTRSKYSDARRTTSSGEETIGTVGCGVTRKRTSLLGEP